MASDPALADRWAGRVTLTNRSVGISLLKPSCPLNGLRWPRCGVVRWRKADRIEGGRARKKRKGGGGRGKAGKAGKAGKGGSPEGPEASKQGTSTEEGVKEEPEQQKEGEEEEVRVIRTMLACRLLWSEEGGIRLSGCTGGTIKVRPPSYTAMDS